GRAAARAREGSARPGPASRPAGSSAATPHRRWHRRNRRSVSAWRNPLQTGMRNAEGNGRKKRKERKKDAREEVSQSRILLACRLLFATFFVFFAFFAAILFSLLND